MGLTSRVDLSGIASIDNTNHHHTQTQHARYCTHIQRVEEEIIMSAPVPLTKGGAIKAKSLMKSSQSRQPPVEVAGSDDAGIREGDEDPQRGGAPEDASEEDAEEEEDRAAEEDSEEGSGDEDALEEEAERAIEAIIAKRMKKSNRDEASMGAKEVLKLLLKERARGRHEAPTGSTSDEDADERSRRRMDKIPSALLPKELKRREASEPKRLSEWLYEANRAFDHMEISKSNMKERLRHMPLIWDQSMDKWWNLRSKALCKEGKEPKSWSEFARILEDHFTPRRAGEEAFTKYYRFNHAKSGETAEQYMELKKEYYDMVLDLEYIRSPSAEHFILAMIEDFDGSRYPRTKIAMREWVQEQQDKKIEMNVVTLIDKAKRWADTELPERAGHASRAHHPGGDKRRVNAVTRPEEAEETISGDMVQRLAEHVAAAVRISSGGAPMGKCRKCGKMGHTAYNCTSKTDLRVCFGCNKPGHIKPNCPEAKSASSSSAKPKNE